jgi:metal dependent phosphohydrolase
VLNELHNMYEPMVGRIKDYISKPKPNGYQSLHTTVVTKNGQAVEFQIRTREMHDYAERGLAASFHYNEQKLTDAYIKGKMTSLPTDLHWIKHLQSAASMIREGKDFDVDNLKVDLFGDRIFIYSPKGDIYDLPDGAFPLDFAYRVHSDLAAKSSGFLVNGKMEPFSYKLQHGDTVEILTNKRARPKPGWNEYVITGHARMKLKAQLKKTSLLGRAGSLLQRTAPFRRNKK